MATADANQNCVTIVRHSFPILARSLASLTSILSFRALFTASIHPNLGLPLALLPSTSAFVHYPSSPQTVGKKLGVLLRCKHYFNSAQLFKLYTGFICPCLEYCSHIWGSSPYTSLLDRVESKAIRLIGDPSLTSTLDPMSLCC